MTNLNQIYKCNLCGNIVNILHIGQGTLVCCEQPMVLQVEKTDDTGVEKHLPVIEKMPENICSGGDGVIVRIGEVNHPMEKDHFIEWVEIITLCGKVGRKFLQPGEKAEVEFHTRSDIKEIRAYCNLHGLWKLTI